MAGTHSRLSASGAPAYSLCLGKPNAEEGLSDDTSVYAAEGTFFHEIAAYCLELGLEPEDFLGLETVEDGFPFTWDQAFCDNMREGLDRFRDLADTGILFVERRVSLAVYLGEGEAGTTDVGIVHTVAREITIGDWKYGAGVPVAPYDLTFNEDGEVTGQRLNRQIVLYALGFWHDVAEAFLGSPEGVKVRLIIEQPRCDGGGGEIVVPLSDLFEIGEELRVIAIQTRDPDAPRTPGEKQCHFCKRRKTPGGCYAYNSWVLEQLGTDFDDMDEDIRLEAPPLLPDPREMTPERRAYIVRHAALIEQFLSDTHALVLADAKHGRDTPGLKLVAGRRPARKWRKDREEIATTTAIGLLGTRAFKVELLTPAQIEAAVGEVDYTLELSRFVDLGTAKPTLAPITARKKRLGKVSDLLSDDDV